MVKNSREIKEIYVLHAINHILKTRKHVLKNNSKITKAQASNKFIEKELRDQGFTRPKVLIILPFRNSALEVVDIMIKLSGTDQQENRKRFYDSYGLTPDQEKINENKPDDFLATFRGNIDDLFRIGIKFTRKSMKLYSKFYSSDIIVASPLGLRMIIGEENDDKKRDFDFLSSIELIIFDQCESFLMQNWDHVEGIFKHLNLIPTSAHDCDFSRVKNWYLDGRHFIRGIRHLIFYALPDHPQFYLELLNSLDTNPASGSDTTSNNTCKVLFMKYDQLRLERIVGSDRINRMISSTTSGDDKKTFVFT
ncbi:14968_t:CDS:2 [Entrophospora sp. SA101]|nr:14968_t:CDS:2 [Entrophospora sp. SA101]CAJ0867502.1 8647_t:CDS:2 [Entrophospora sp. SA101]